MSPLSPLPMLLSGQDDAWLQSVLASVRQQFEDDLRRALLALVETFDDVDNLTKEDFQDPTTLSERLRILRGKLDHVIGELGLVRVPAVGQLLDPQRHHVEEVAEGNQPPGTIIRELRAGYEFRDRLLRPSVVVSTATDDASQPANFTPE